MSASQTPRRSTRISSVAPSAAGSVRSVRTTATTKTTGRGGAKAAPLPRLNVQNSSAYGASGNPLLNTNQPAQGDLASLLEKHRGSAIQREAPGTTPAARKVTRQDTSPAAVAAKASMRPEVPLYNAEVNEEDDENEEDEDSLEEEEIRPRNQRQSVLTPAARARVRNAPSRQARTSIVQRQTHRSEVSINGGSFIESPSKSFGSQREAGLIAAAQPPTARAQPPPPRRPFTTIAKEYLSNLPKPSWWHIMALLALIIAAAAALKGEDLYDTWNLSRPSFEDPSTDPGMFPSVQASLRNVQRELNVIKKELPEFMRVVYNPDNRKYEIPREFWPALAERIDGRVDRLWNELLAKNQGVGGAGKTVMTSEDFSGLLDNNIQEKLLNSMTPRIRQLIKAEIRELPRDTPKTQVLQGIAYENMVQNARTAYNLPNFFSRGYLPIVIPKFTSPAYKPRYEALLKRTWTLLGASPRVNAPVAALESWEEPGDCWHAAVSTNKGAQLTIEIREHVFPSSFTIENFPKDGLLDTSSAPEGVELWAHVPDVEQRKNVQSYALGCSDPSGAHHEYACIGKATYSIDAPNHVQTFMTDIDLGNLGGISSKRFMVRITSTHGADYACLYRVRLHGRPAISEIDA